jgi:acyl-CoA thioesterase-2
MDFNQLFRLEPHGPDTYVGAGPRYPWGGLYGGHIVAQALRAAAATVEDAFVAHSLRAYFIRPGDHTEPVRYEVDRIRNGRSFCTRRVVARQAIGAILNLEASFQRGEGGDDVQPIAAPRALPRPEGLEQSSWTTAFERAWVPSAALDDTERNGSGRVAAWMRAADDLGDDQLLHQCALAYISDDLPTDAAIQAHPRYRERRELPDTGLFCASLDHTIWFHRTARADEWHLYDVTCHAFVGTRGLSVGHVFAGDGTHVATIAQEVLIRDRLSG